MIVNGTKKEKVEIEISHKELINALSKELIGESSLYNVFYNKEKKCICKHNMAFKEMFVTDNEHFIKAYLAIREINDLLFKKEEIENKNENYQKYIRENKVR